MLALSEMNTDQERASASRLEIHNHDRCVRPLVYYHALANTAHRVRFGRRDFCPLPRLHQTATDTKHAFETLKSMATTNAQWIPATQSLLSSLFSLLSSLFSLLSSGITSACGVEESLVNRLTHSFLFDSITRLTHSSISLVLFA